MSPADVRDAGPDGGGGAAAADDAAAAPTATDEFRPPGGWFEAPEPGVKCGEGPERRAARENMQRMAAEHERTVASLRDARQALEALALDVATTLALERVPTGAAELAARAATVPGAPPADAGYLEALLREAAFWGALCRTLQDGEPACDRLDAGGDGDGAYCQSAANLVRLARARPERLSLPSAVGHAFGWGWAWQSDERIWQVVLRGKGEAACDGLVGRDPPARWLTPACRALAARDAARCAELAEPARGRTCAALLHALLGPGVAAGDRPSAAGTLLRAHVTPTADGPRCADALPRIVAELLDGAAVLELGPLVLPEIERQRGLAPPP